MSSFAQPAPDTAYNQPSNPTSKTPLEAQHATSDFSSHQRSGQISDVRTSGDLAASSSHGQKGTPSSLGYGVRDGKEDRQDELGGPVSNVEGEKMRPPGEGDVYQAQTEKDGFGEQADLAADLDRKKQEQEEIKAAKGVGVYRNEERDVDLQEAVGGERKGFVGAGG